MNYGIHDMKEAQFGSSPDLLKEVIISAFGTGGGHLRLHPPTGGSVEAARSAMEGSVCPDALDLIGLGAIGSAEEAPPSLASSLADFFITSSSLLDTSTLISISR
jgi:hypothetical protein